MSWAILEKLLNETQTHSTLIGKYWITFMFIFRIIVVLNVGDKVSLLCIKLKCCVRKLYG